MQLSVRRFKRCCRRGQHIQVRRGLLTTIADPADNTLYTWDADNRLSRIEQGGANPLTATFTYDAMGRRIQSSITKTGQGASQTATVQYLYEGAQTLGEIRDGKLSHRLLAGLGLDETIARIAIAASGAKDPAASRIFLTDALNSVIAQMSDADDPTLQTSYGYSPYGQSTTVGTDSTNNPIQYTSRENDGTGLFYYRARYYDPVLKRFVSEDPIGLAGGWNWYGYVGGNPVSLRDATGNCPWCIGAVIGGLAAGVGALNSGAEGWQLAAAVLVGAGSGALGTVGFGLIGTPMWVVSSGISGGFAGFAGNLAGQLVGGTEVCDLDYKQATVQGVVGFASGFYGAAMAVETSVFTASQLSAANSGAISSWINLLLPTKVGGMKKP